MTIITETQRIRALEKARRGSAAVIHGLRRVASPHLRGQPAHSTLISTATYSPWLVDRGFKAVAEDIRDYTLLDEMRLYELWQLADQVGHLPGDGIEVGCWRGGAGTMIAKRLSGQQPDVTMFLCDTFAGVVKAGRHDRIYFGGEHGDASEAAAREVAARLGVDNTEILIGVFPEDTGDQVKDRVFKFAHIDVDVYQGVRDSFFWLLPRLVRGGIVVFDDYGGSATEGVRTFIDELHGHPDVVIVRNLNGQAVAIRWGMTTPGPEEA